MAHVHRVVFVAGAAVKDHHIVVAAVAVLQHGGVAGLPGIVIQPFTQNRGAVREAVRRGIGGGGLILCGCILQRGARLVGGVDGICGGLGSGHGLRLHLVGDLDGVALFICISCGAVDADIRTVHQIVGGPVLLIGGLQLVGGVGQTVLIGLEIGGGQQAAPGLLLIDAAGHGAAVDETQILLFRIAVRAGSGGKGLHGVVQVGLHLVVPGEALGLCSGIHGLDAGQLLQGLVREVVVPSLALGGVGDEHDGAGGDGLVLQGRAGVQPDHAQNAVIAVDKVLIVVLKIEVDLSGGVLLTVDGGRRSRLGNDVGLPDDGGNGDYQEYHSDGAIQKVGAVLLLALLGLPGGLGIVPAGAGQVLAGLFFS